MHARGKAILSKRQWTSNNQNMYTENMRVADPMCDVYEIVIYQESRS